MKLKSALRVKPLNGSRWPARGKRTNAGAMDVGNTLAAVLLGGADWLGFSANEFFICRHCETSANQSGEYAHGARYIVRNYFLGPGMRKETKPSLCARVASVWPF